MKKFVHGRRIVLLCAGLLVLTFIGVELYISSFALTFSTYEITTASVKSTIRIVQLTDLHDSEFGKENEKLVSKVYNQSPDLILITGDLVDYGDEDTDIATNLISQLCEICPVYISYGNHEYEYEEVYSFDLTLLYEDAGATVLEKEYTDITVNGQTIRLGGIYGYCLPSKYLETNEADPEECAFLEEFQNTDLYTVLMCHMPVCWLLNDGLEEWNIDCVLAGHVHGGQVIIPGIGGFTLRISGGFLASWKVCIILLMRVK